MGLIVGVGVFDQRGGGAGGVRIGIKFSVFGGVGRGALTKFGVAAAALTGKGGTAPDDGLAFRDIK